MQQDHTFFVRGGHRCRPLRLPRGLREAATQAEHKRAEPKNLHAVSGRDGSTPGRRGHSRRLLLQKRFGRVHQTADAAGAVEQLPTLAGFIHHLRQQTAQAASCGIRVDV